ncbi:pseudouridylate synthase 3 [Coccidioides immitis H538.4]|uniref:Pseudouridylate synthase 3 n=1 Tax=Coccidioides immitis H538.4 TaxID=396776 RepID=A0A0J8RD27_COCIT|nr:pseudouridylate synthase 3 [Coccidioides immitis H538.4]
MGDIIPDRVKLSWELLAMPLLRAAVARDFFGRGDGEANSQASRRRSWKTSLELGMISPVRKLHCFKGASKFAVSLLSPLPRRQFYPKHLFSSTAMSATNDTPSAAGVGPQPDYSTWDTARLISRITELEQQLSSSTENQARGRSKPTNDLPPTSPLINPGDSYPPGPLTPSRSSSRAARPARDIDPSKYNTRFIALKFAYLGQRYNGYEHANGNITPLPTIEEELFKALRKSRLIFPKTVENGVTTLSVEEPTAESALSDRSSV